MTQKKEKYRIKVLDQDREFLCPPGTSLLSNIERINSRCVKIGCRGGGCGICKIRVVEGHFTCKSMSKAHISDEDQDCGYVLACRVFPISDLKIKAQLNPKRPRNSTNNKNRGRP